jgi:hypothetical protein
MQRVVQCAVYACVCVCVGVGIKAKTESDCRLYEARACGPSGLTVDRKSRFESARSFTTPDETTLRLWILDACINIFLFGYQAVIFSAVGRQDRGRTQIFPGKHGRRLGITILDIPPMRSMVERQHQHLSWKWQTATNSTTRRPSFRLGRRRFRGPELRTVGNREVDPRLLGISSATHFKSRTQTHTQHARYVHTHARKHERWRLVFCEILLSSSLLLSQTSHHPASSRSPINPDLL